MKLLRICLLVLLSALLPVRGAMAAAMLCAPVQSSHCHEAGEADMPGASAPDETPQSVMSEASGSVHAGDGVGHEKCSLCASCCSAVPLISSLASVLPTLDAPDRFPEPFVAAPSFIADAQERPPRSL